MAIALRHQYVVNSSLANNPPSISYPDAVKNKLDLAKKTAAAFSDQQSGQVSTQQGSPMGDLPGQIKPVWIGSPDVPVRRMSLQPLQEWEGYVIDVTGEVFTARLVDRTANQRVEEETAEFPISDLSDDDRALLRPGAVFRWVIGYQRSIGGNKRRVSQVVFRRMPAWSTRDISNAKKRAAKLFEQIDWE